MELIIKISKYDSQSLVRFNLLKEYGLSDNEILKINEFLINGKFKFLEIKNHIKRLKIGEGDLFKFDLEQRLKKILLLGKDSSSLDSHILRYGEEKGKAIWEEKTKKTTPLDNKNLKFNGTKESLIELYGLEDGLVRWDSYCEKRNKTYSENRQNGKYKHMNQIEIYIKKHGEEKGREKFREAQTKRTNFHNKNRSQIANDLFNNIIKKIDYDLNLFIIKYGKSEKGIWITEGRRAFPDFYFQHKDRKEAVCIEFFGDYFHANPAIYNEDFLISTYKGKKSSKFIWDRDSERLDLLKKIHPVLVIWEKDYRDNKKEVINKCIEFLTEYINE